MKKFQLHFLTLAILLISTTSFAKTIKLHQPDTTSPLMKIIDNRTSIREYSDKAISEDELSNILWAAFGINSHNTRTIPTARNLQDLKVFVVYNNAIWQYDAKENALNKISDENIMPYLALQPFVLQAPVHLIYAGGKQTAEAHSGSAYQNVSLYAAEKGLASVVRGSINRDTLHQKLKLGDNEIVTYHQTIGYPKN